MRDHPNITLDPAVMGGKPCIRGMRVTVGTVIGLLAAGRAHEQILEDYPYLTQQDILDALAYAAWRLEESELPLTGDKGPSVLQVRDPAPTPENVGKHVLLALAQHAQSLDRGALVTVDPSRSRVRMLPLVRGSQS